jgi:hypothetical protein
MPSPGIEGSGSLKFMVLKNAMAGSQRRGAAAGLSLSIMRHGA